jgi:hypothetical protein
MSRGLPTEKTCYQNRCRTPGFKPIGRGTECRLPLIDASEPDLSRLELLRSSVELRLSSIPTAIQRETPPVIQIDGEVEAKILVVTWSEPLEGHRRWVLQFRHSARWPSTL